VNFHPDRRAKKKQSAFEHHSILFDSQNVKVEDYDQSLMMDSESPFNMTMTF